MDNEPDLDALQVGAKLKLFYSSGNVNNKIMEVRGVIDGCYVVVRSRRSSSSEWRYAMEDIDFLRMALDAGHLTAG